MRDEKLSVITGASSGFGYHFARFSVEDGHKVIICGASERIGEAAENLRRLGGDVEAMQVDLATENGVTEFWRHVEGRPVDRFFANAGRALGDAFHEQEWIDVKRLIDLNVKQTTSLLHKIGRQMRARGQGRILVTGSIGGQVPGPYDAVYNATKAYLDSLCWALRDELKETGVTITCLMPGPTETRIFDEKGLEDSPIHEREKDDPVEVARGGYDAMIRGDAELVPGSFSNRLISLLSGVAPKGVLAEIHRRGAQPKR